MADDPGPTGWRRWATVEDGRAPLVLTVLFYVAVSLILASAAVDFGLWRLDTPRADPAGSVTTLIAILVAAGSWPSLRWRRDGRLRDRLLGGLFVAAATTVLSIGGWAGIVMQALVIVYVVVAFGFRVALGYTVVLAATAFAISWGYRHDPTVAVIETVLAVVSALWAAAMASALLSQQRQARRTRELLAERTRANEELRGYAARVEELTVAAERARMSREMHDSVGHYLTVISLGLRNAQRYHRAGVGDAWAEVRQAEELTIEALAETRRWVKALRPLALEDSAGPAAMTALARSYPGVAVEFTADEPLPSLDRDVELLLYRAMQEGLANVVRHSLARDVLVTLSADDAVVELSITDQGPRRPGTTTGTGFGLTGLRQRAATVAGTVSTTHPADGGFRLTVTAPLPRAATPLGRDHD